MDPLSVSASVVAFVQLAMQIKASVDKISRNRQRMRELAEDILLILVDLKKFYEANGRLGQDVALETLKQSFDRLMSDLSQVYERCQHHLRSEGKGKLQKLARHWKVWKNTDSLEADLARLRENIYYSLMRNNLFISARSEVTMARVELISTRNEVAIARLEHNVLVRPANDQLRVRQFDSILGQSVCEGNPDLSALSVFHSTTTDDIDRQYLRLKSRNIARVLEARPSAVSFDLRYTIKDTYFRCVEDSLSPLILMEIVGKLAEVWHGLHSVGPGVIASYSVDLIFYLASIMSRHGCGDVTLVIFDTLEGILRSALQSHSSQHDLPNILSGLAWTISWRCSLADPGRDTTQLAMEVLTIHRQLLGYSDTSFTLSERRYFLHYDLRELAIAQLTSGDLDGSLSSCAEALEVLRHAFPPEGSNQVDEDAVLWWYCTTQSSAYTLFLQTLALAKNGEFTRAYYSGTEAITNIDLLWTRAADAPKDFNFLRGTLAFLKEALPSWTSIVRNPSSSSIECVDEESSVSNLAIEDGDAY